MKIRRGDLPEPPPKGWDQLGVKPGFTVEHYPAAQIDALCRAAGVVPGSENWNRQLIKNCVDMNGRRVLLAEGADPVLEAARIAHEGGGHSWGLIHSQTGREWLQRDGTPAKPIDAATAKMMISMALAEQKRGMFAQREPPAKGLFANLNEAGK